MSRRYQISQDSLFKVPPNLEEQDIIHDFFLNTIDHKAMSFKARVKPGNSVWMEDAKLKNLIVCQPQNRNRSELFECHRKIAHQIFSRFNKIFGGFIMRQAFELAWANSYVFGRITIQCKLDNAYYSMQFTYCSKDPTQTNPRPVPAVVHAHGRHLVPVPC